MSKFHVELKKIVDDSYDVEIGNNLADKLISDLKNGLVGNINKFVVVTDSIVKDLYAQKIYEKLSYLMQVKKVKLEKQKNLLKIV